MTEDAADDVDTDDGPADDGRTAARSRRLLQLVVAILSLVPIAAGAGGVLLGPSFVVGASGWPPDLDSHFRYLSGIFVMLGLTFLSTVPGIEDKTRRFRLAAALVVAGGLGRLVSLLIVGTPTVPHIVGLGLELVVVPTLVIWQGRVARDFA